MLATKLRALLQRNKGRDLFDLDHALTVFEGLDTARIVECFRLYIAKAELTISRAEAQQRMFQKLANPTFFTDMRPLLSTDRAKALTDETLKATFVRVMKDLIDRIPGDGSPFLDHPALCHHRYQQSGWTGMTRSDTGWDK